MYSSVEEYVSESNKYFYSTRETNVLGSQLDVNPEISPVTAGKESDLPKVTYQPSEGIEDSELEGGIIHGRKRDLFPGYHPH